jgi:hypothetical protein
LTARILKRLDDGQPLVEVARKMKAIEGMQPQINDMERRLGIMQSVEPVLENAIKTLQKVVDVRGMGGKTPAAPAAPKEEKKATPPAGKATEEKAAAPAEPAAEAPAAPAVPAELAGEAPAAAAELQLIDFHDKVKAQISEDLISVAPFSLAKSNKSKDTILTLGQTSKKGQLHNLDEGVKKRIDEVNTLLKIAERDD